jgi:hypothetical protein
LNGVISPSEGRYLLKEQHKHRINLDIHASSGIRTHDPSVRGTKMVHVINRAVTLMVTNYDTERIYLELPQIISP